MEHQDGVVLFDTGFSPEAGKLFPVRFSDENRLENQLKNVGLEPKDIDVVCLSHLHFDHVGQVGIFKKLNTPVIVHKNELEYALYMLWQGKGGGYTAEDLLPLRGLSWYPITGEAFQVYDGVELLFTGAHTPGHMILRAITGPGDSYIFTGDFIHLPEQYGSETGGSLMGDYDEFHSYIRKLKAMVSIQGSKLVIGHDPDLWKKFKKSPRPLGPLGSSSVRVARP